MPRTEGDTWNLASSVGATATMVAAGRAMASRDARGLINDPFAAPLVRAVGIEFFTKMIDDELDLSQLEGGSPERVQAMIGAMAVRTKFFDDYFSTATGGGDSTATGGGDSALATGGGDSSKTVGTGIRQAVILASGLDSRAYRLPWPAGTVVYEIDQPAVIEFKSTTLARIGATPTAERRAVPIDLRDDWPAALRAAGFDTTVPTAWCAEGLLIYLPPEAQDRLFDDITGLSVPGSTVATEYVPGIMDFDDAKAREMSAPLRDHGLDIDMPSLVYAGDRSHVTEYLRGSGWTITSTPSTELFLRNGLTVPPPEYNGPLGEIEYVSGTLTAC